MEIGEQELYLMNEFERITSVMPTFFVDMEDTFVFVVGSTKPFASIQKLRERLNKNVLIVLDSDDADVFTRNLFKNVNLLTISVDSAKKQIHVTVAEKDRSLAIGRGGFRIKIGKKLLKDKFGCELMLHYTMMQ